METVNILLTSPLGESCLSRIAAVSPRVRVRDISALHRADAMGDTSSKDTLDAVLAGAEVIYGHRFPGDIVHRAPRLKWMQAMSAGIEMHLNEDLRRSPVILTNMRGLHATPIGEFVLEQMLMFAKGAHRCFEMKQQREWKHYTPSVLRGKTVGIIGLGKIGKEVARLSRAFGMRVLATRRSVRQTATARNVDVLLPRDGLPQLLAESDYVVIALPYTAETEGLIGEVELRAMKPSACLVNIGRGRIINEEVLVRALSENWIAGAGLDVFATEPLPRESQLWDMPNLFFSPHVSGNMEEYEVHATDVFLNNLKRYLEGRPLLNVVNKRRGY